jgi:hypothetical protein
VSGPVSVAVPAGGPASADADCAHLEAALPATLDPQLARRTTTPTSIRTAAWGTPPVILRCGVDRPAVLQPTSQLADVNGVGWFQHLGGRTVTWTAVDRAVYVELVVPTAYADQSGFLVDIGAAVTAALPAQPVDTSRP